MFVLSQESSESANTTIEDEDIKGTVNRTQTSDQQPVLALLYIHIHLFSEQ